MLVAVPVGTWRLPEPCRLYFCSQLVDLGFLIGEHQHVAGIYEARQVTQQPRQLLSDRHDLNNLNARF